MDINKNWIKVYIIDVLPCITVSLYILALLYNISFFSVYNINVLSYVSFSDLLLTIVEPLLILSFTFFILFAFVFYIDTLYSTDKKLYLFLKSLYNPVMSFWYGLVFAFKILFGLLAKIKFLNSVINRFKQSLYRFYCPVKKILNDYNNKELEREKNRNYNIFITFLSTILLMALLYYLYSLIIPHFNLSGMTKAVIALILPIICFCYNFAFGVWDIHPGDKNQSSKYSIYLLAFYVYAVFIFYRGGIDCANYYMENDMVKFEITTNNGACFNDSSYVYIEHINDNYFLLDKKSRDIVILNNSGIIYSKLHFLNEERNSMFMYILSKANN